MLLATSAHLLRAHVRVNTSTAPLRFGSGQ